ncbi:serine/threonine-protein kinase [Nocardioides koreensis]|uniref:non-specific serine/threonine protein kinase n=1 Tax=Nocardioides koreensis TaxID=433651 RepID=A0ABN2ZGI6_9ACTN
MPPETIAGRYHVEREVGRGGMGSVWLCRDELLGRAVAVKQVGRLPGESTTDLARAMREARSSAALNHRNVVAVYDAIEEGDHIWLVMEYVPGRTLSQIVAADGPLPPERAAWIGAQVADGLAAAHARGTVHRDVKPGNILVTDEDLAKISDFGIARTHGDATLTQSGMVTGTPAYFSPEQARGEEASPASDVWALGATLYAAVEGHGPYPEQPNALALLSRIAAEPPTAPERAGVLAEPIGRMLDPDPRSRWAMADASHALHRIHDRNAEAGTREELPVASGPATTALPVTAVAPEEPAGATTTAERPVAEPTGRRGRRRALLAALGVLVLVAAIGLLWWASTTDDPSTSAGPSAERSSRSPSGSPSASRTPSQTPTTQSPSPSETTSNAGQTSGSTQKFVTGYYGVLPDDTRSGWAMLSSGFQKEIGSYGKYRGFWNSIDSVEVTGTSQAGPNAVDAFLTYTRQDGSTASEVRRLFLEQSGDGYLITGDQLER